MFAGDGRLLVNVARLYETRDHIHSALHTLRTQLMDLETQAKPLVETWSGQAQQAYLARQATWRAAADELTAMLESINRGLDESIVDYQQAEARNAGLFS